MPPIRDQDLWKQVKTLLSISNSDPKKVSFTNILFFDHEQYISYCIWHILHALFGMLP